MLKQHLQQKLLQKLSPQQIQVIRLLELPTMELEERIKHELEDNPALEEGR
ncbi:MAG: RNA polymerase factor sigma-54, partial [Tannerellaceae bacterium]